MGVFRIFFKLSIMTQEMTKFSMEFLYMEYTVCPCARKDPKNFVRRNSSRKSAQSHSQTTTTTELL